jgi:hypothetical protein
MRTVGWRRAAYAAGSSSTASAEREEENLSVERSLVASKAPVVDRAPGFSLGAALGGFMLLHATVINLGRVGAACEVVALALFLVVEIATRRVGDLDTPQPERLIRRR